MVTDRDIRALDILCSRILGCGLPDRTVPCPCDLCRDKVRRHRKYRELPSTGTHGVTLARNRMAWLEEQLTA